MIVCVRARVVVRVYVCVRTCARADLYFVKCRNQKIWMPSNCLFRNATEKIVLLKNVFVQKTCVRAASILYVCIQ